MVYQTCRVGYLSDHKKPVEYNEGHQRVHIITYLFKMHKTPPPFHRVQLAIAECVNQGEEALSNQCDGMPSFLTDIKADMDTESLKGWCMLNDLSFAMHVAVVSSAL